MADSSTSSTSQSNSKKTQPFHFRAKFKNQDIQLVANLQNLHQHTIKLSIKNLQRKQSYNTQEKMAARNQPGRNQTKDLKCTTHLLSDKFRNMSEEKKAIVRDLGFGGLMHIPPLRVHHQLLRELANNFKLGENRLKTGYSSFKITPRKIGHALAINATGDLFPQKVDYKKLSEDDKVIFRRFQGKTLKSLIDEMMDIGVGNEEDRLMFKRIFILYIQMAFLLPTTINKISPVHLAPIFEMDSITERNWGGHVLTFIVKGITDYKEKKKKVIDGCLFALMIIYFHLSKKKGKKRAERPPKSWIANWSKEQLVERMNAETEEILASSTSSSEEETTDSDSSTSESETQEDSEDSPRKYPSKKGKKTQSKKKKVVVEHSSPEEDQYFDGYSTSERYEISSEDLDELLRENDGKSAAEGENEADLRLTEGRYVSSETIPAVNLGSDDPSSQGGTEQSSVNKPAESMLSPVQQSASEPADSNMMVVREQTPSDALVIVPIQVFVPMSQITTVPELEETPETDFEPIPLLQIEGTTETHPAAEDVAALMMMARTASNVPKTDPVLSFSLGLTDSSQEEAATQEGASTQETEREKSPETANLLEQLEDLVQKIASSAAKKESRSPQIQKETGRESSGKFETPEGINQITDDMKEKCYIWGTRLKTYADGGTNEYDHMCTLIAQDNYILNRMHLASLQAESYIESEIASAMCLILNQKNDKRFQEQVYCLPPDIVNMALSKHPKGEFISPKTNKEFRVEDYPSFIPFIDAKTLTSHPYIFAPVCYSGHWWLWVIDTTKRRFHILDPLHKKSPSDERKQLNKFTGYVISRLRAYAGREPMKKDEKEKEIKASYVKISSQKSSYDCAIYVMKWLELIESENIKKGKYEWDNWKQEEVDHYRVEYASRILFSELNKERDQAIKESNAIRLSKPSSVLLSPFCQINSTDIETA
ncbi:hypothetical protein Ahy_B04g072963 [Arachis hypogaea]|uniref:Ubiquitin-like protease family profile domain-containing protein n=1 Tax=Arachis hypogaea TaxID=3818 RepID=A0A444ZPC7_ARAHY|nr:hypothetical protein Ahy_B04g072963 [Arachis hypogaea]